MRLREKAIAKSLWVFHFCSASCNNCDIEILDCLTPRYDLERFGILLVGSVRQADVILVSGALNKKGAKRLKRLYEQASKPCLVIAVGSCAVGQGIFRGSYPISERPVDEVLPVACYVPGCPPKPEAIIAGVAKVLERLRGER